MEVHGSIDWGWPQSRFRGGGRSPRSMAAKAAIHGGPGRLAGQNGGSSGSQWRRMRPAKKAPAGSTGPHGVGGGRGSVVIDFGDGFADGAFVQRGLLVNQPGHEGGVAELVDAARQALGVLEDAGNGIVGEEGAGVVARRP